MTPETEPDARRPNRTEVVAGLCVVALCAAFAWQAAGYGIGTPRRIGAGFFPFFLSLIGIGLGAGIALMGWRRPSAGTLPVRWRRLAFIAAAFLIFGLAVEPAGLLLTIPAVTVIGALGDPDTRLREAVLLGVGLALGIWVVFVLLLGLSIPVLPGER